MDLQPAVQCPKMTFSAKWRPMAVSGQSLTNIVFNGHWTAIRTLHICWSTCTSPQLTSSPHHHYPFSSSLLWTKLAPLNHAHFFCTIMLLHWASCQREPNVSDILLSLLTWTTHFGALISNKPHSDPQQLIYWLFLSWILIAPIAVIH